MKDSPDDYTTAWNIAVRATELRNYYDQELANLEYIMDEAAVSVEELENIRSIELGNTVADGKRKAAADSSVVANKSILNKAKYNHAKLKSVIKTLDNIHFLAKSCYEFSSRKYRNT